MQAPVTGDLFAGGKLVTLDSAVGGNARLEAKHLVIGPNARISGDLAYRAEQVDISPQAVISGQKIVLPPEEGARFRWTHEKHEPPTLAHKIASGLFGAAAFAVLALGLAALVPGLMTRAGDMVGRNPLMAGLTGVLVLVLAPAAALVLLVILFGAPLAATVMLIWALLIALGVAAAAAGLGLLIRRLARRGSAPETPALAGQLGWTLLGAVVLCVLGAIPFIGGWVWVIACLLGAGAVAAQGRALLAARS
jgi:hypothetical protein